MAFTYFIGNVTDYRVSVPVWPGGKHRFYCQGYDTLQLLRCLIFKNSTNTSQLTRLNVVLHYINSLCESNIYLKKGLLRCLYGLVSWYQNVRGYQLRFAANSFSSVGTLGFYQINLLKMSSYVRCFAMRMYTGWAWELSCLDFLIYLLRSSCMHSVWQHSSDSLCIRYFFHSSLYSNISRSHFSVRLHLLCPHVVYRFCKWMNFSCP